MMGPHAWHRENAEILWRLLSYEKDRYEWGIRDLSVVDQAKASFKMGSTHYEYLLSTQVSRPLVKTEGIYHLGGWFLPLDDLMGSEMTIFEVPNLGTFEKSVQSMLPTILTFLTEIARGYHRERREKVWTKTLDAAAAGLQDMIGGTISASRATRTVQGFCNQGGGVSGIHLEYVDTFIGLNAIECKIRAQFVTGESVTKTITFSLF